MFALKCPQKLRSFFAALSSTSYGSSAIKKPKNTRIQNEIRHRFVHEMKDGFRSDATYCQGSGK